MSLAGLGGALLLGLVLAAGGGVAAGRLGRALGRGRYAGLGRALLAAVAFVGATGALAGVFAVFGAARFDAALGEALLGMYGTLGGNVGLLGWAWGAGIGLGGANARGLPEALGVAATGFLVAAGWTVLVPALGGPPVEQAAFAGLDQAPLDARLLAGAFVVVGAPVTEELLWRGLVFGVASRRLTPRATLWVVAVLFAAMHGADPWAVPPVFALALGLGWLRARFGSVVAPMVAHVLFNAAGFAALVAG